MHSKPTTSYFATLGWTLEVCKSLQVFQGKITLTFPVPKLTEVYGIEYAQCTTIIWQLIAQALLEQLFTRITIWQNDKAQQSFPHEY